LSTQSATTTTSHEITIAGGVFAKPCGHRPLLIARSLPRRVTLRLVNRDISNCHVEAVGVITVSVMLPRASHMHEQGGRRPDGKVWRAACRLGCKAERTA
jgi:hypothetical protein